LQALLRLDKPLPVVRDKPVQSNGLSDEIGDHREKANVLVQANTGVSRALPIDGERPDDTSTVLDGHTDEGQVRVR
jgi:hypothetical protein